MSLWESKISPMLAHSSKPFNSDEWLFEVKFDGTRTIAYIDVKERKVSFLNRRGIWFEDRYPELKEIWKNINATRVILDGEIVIFKEGRPDFYLLAEREHVSTSTRIELLSQLNPATYVVFDILHLDGKDLVYLPLIERKKILEKVAKESKELILSTYIIGKGEKFFEEVKKKELEGIVAKKLDSFYEIGKRSKNWLKIKVLNTLDVVIGGYTLGEGKREGYFGALLCGVLDKGKLRYVGRVGTGFNEDLLKSLTEKLKKIETDKNPFEIFEEEPAILKKVRWVKPKLIAEVKFMNLSEDLKMRAPAFKRLREDKPIEECELEV